MPVRFALLRHRDLFAHSEAGRIGETFLDAVHDTEAAARIRSDEHSIHDCTLAVGRERLAEKNIVAAARKPRSGNRFHILHLTRQPPLFARR